MGATRDGMQEVDLAEVDLDLAPPDDLVPHPAPDRDAVLRRRRARLLRWWPVAALAVAGVVTTQLVIDARERQRVEAARGVDGVVAEDVGPDVTVTPAGHGWDRWRLLLGIVAGDLRVAADESVAGEPRTVTAADAVSGERVWRTAVEEAPADPGAALADPPVCSAGDAPVVQVWCVVQDRGPGSPQDDSGYAAPGPITRSRLVTLDAATGAVLAERVLAPVATALVAGDLLVVVEVEQGAARARAEDLGTGRIRWVTDLPAPPPEAVELVGTLAPGLSIEAGHVLVHQPLSGASLRLSDGTLEASGIDVSLGRGDRLVSAGSDGYTWLRGTDGTGTARVLADPLYLTVDDGSVPDLDLLVDSRTGATVLSAVDPATGATVWEHEAPDWVDGSQILLDGVLYGGDATAVWALDIRDGTQRWRTEQGRAAPTEHQDGTSGWSSTWLTPMTDGRQLLLVQYEDEQPLLSAWSLASGAHLWSSPLPAEAGQQLTVWGHAMYGGDGDLVQVRGGSGR
jgi:outer membrane protein assembly factor BamB